MAEVATQAGAQLAAPICRCLRRVSDQPFVDRGAGNRRVLDVQACREHRVEWRRRQGHQTRVGRRVNVRWLAPETTGPERPSAGIRTPPLESRRVAVHT